MISILLIAWLVVAVVLAVAGLRANWDMIKNYGVKNAFDIKTCTAIVFWPFTLLLVTWYIFRHKK